MLKQLTFSLKYTAFRTNERRTNGQKVFHDIEMEIQLAEAAAETENVTEIVIVDNNKIIPIHASTDYLFRGEDLQDLNFIEYMVLIGKEPIKKQREDSMDIQDKVLLPIPTRGGRIANRRYHFGAPTALKYPADAKLIQIHPQSSTHVQYSVSLLKGYTVLHVGWTC